MLSLSVGCEFNLMSFTTTVTSRHLYCKVDPTEKVEGDEDKNTRCGTEPTLKVTTAPGHNTVNCNDETIKCVSLHSQKYEAGRS